MRGIHQQLQIARSSVTILNGKWKHAVIAPIPRARKLRDRHYLDSGYAKSGKSIECGAQGIEGSFICEGSHVQFVKHAVRQLQTFPIAMGPLEILQVDKFRRSVYSIRLPARCRIG